MNSLVIYATTSGNTAAIAAAIADAVRARGPVELMTADEAPSSLPPADVVFVGCPTEGRAMTRPMLAFLDRLEAGSVRDVPVAAFDTRLAWPRILSGSAAVAIAKRLAAAGARLVRPPESFIVSTKPALEPGERRRAALWAGEVADAVAGGTRAVT